MTDKGVCDKGYAWNPSNCECKCDKSYSVVEYENCKCKKRLIDKLVDECDENIDEVKIVSESKNKCNSYRLYIVLLSIFFTINFGIGAYFFNFHVYLKKMFTCETTIYWTYKWNKLILITELIIFLLRSNWFKRFWCKFVKSWQKRLQRDWHLLHWLCDC